MLDVRAFLHTARRPRVGTVVITAALVAVGVLAWSTEQRRASLHQEVRSLRARLAGKRDQVTQQREEMAEVAGAVERMVRTVNGLNERAAQARRLAHMEESSEPMSGLVPVSTTRDVGSGLVSEDAARALEQLSLLDAQTNAAADSLAVITALLKTQPLGGADVPSLWPVRGLVTSPFGTRASPYDDGMREMHPGIDIRAHYGMPVIVGGDGEVIFAGRDPGYGGLVVVAHGGDIDSLYGHLSAIYVREGQRLYRGQTVGAVGASGRATGAHLHYEVRVRNHPVDPHRYLVN